MQLFPTGRLYVLCHHRVLMLSFIMYYELQSKTVLTLKYRWQDCKLNCVHVSSICELMHAFITERQCLVPKYCIPCVLFRIHWWEAQGLATRANLQCRFLKERKKKKKRERERVNKMHFYFLWNYVIKTEVCTCYIFSVLKFTPFFSLLLCPLDLYLFSVFP